MKITTYFKIALVALCIPLFTLGQTNRGENIENYLSKLGTYHIFKTIQANTGANTSGMKAFREYYTETIAYDKSYFVSLVMNGTIVSDADVQNFANTKINQYTTLYNNFINLKGGITLDNPALHSAMSTCNPSCDNIDFENGSLSAWTACYATNNSTSSTSTGFSITGETCSGTLTTSSTTAAVYPTTGYPQVSITSGTGLDPIAGSFIPVVCPTGGNYSVRIGDGANPNYGVGILKQSFQVSPSNPYITFMYAVLLENPGHTYYQQPHFTADLLDSIGDTIGKYLEVSAPGLPGFKSFYYATDADTVYAKTWTTVSLSLSKYAGQCVTLIASTYDCALGGHFGYAYFDARCGKTGIIAQNGNAVCGSNATLTAPGLGASSYKWTGPCIVGSDSGSSVTVSCGGVYRLIMKNNLGMSGTVDTLYDTVGSGPPVGIKLVSKNNVLCNAGNSGSAVVLPVGGTKPFTYSWSSTSITTDSAKGLVAGPYTVTVTDSNGCIHDTSFTITQPTALSTTIKGINASCGKSNGSAMVTVTGGTTPYAYNWSPSGGTGDTAKALAANSYTCTITDGNGCNVSPSVTISDTSNLVDSVKVTNASCNGACNGTAIAGQSGGTGPYSYTWSTGATTSTISALCASNYTLTVTDANGCSTLKTFTVTQPGALTVTVDSLITGGCSNSAWAVVTGGSGPYTYSWSDAQSKDTATALCNGTYTVTVTDAKGCAATGTIVIVSPTGIAPVQNVNGFTLYPVPASGILNISITGSFTPESLMVYDMTGRELMNRKVNMNTNIITIDVSKLEQGAYILKLVSGNSQKLSRFVVVK